MEESISKAKILIEALPFIRKHTGKVMVIKYGGSVMRNSNATDKVVSDISLMKYVGINPVVIHGGGPQINEYLKKLSLETSFQEGLRVTDEETMKVVKMVLLGLVNKELVNRFNLHGCSALGLSGEDGSFILARPYKKELGQVGEVEKVKGEFLEKLIAEGYLPVVASLGVDREGQSYNINADLVAAEIASALSADKLIYLTDVKGLYSDFENREGFISKVSKVDVRKMLDSNKVSEGMIPKLGGAVKALEGGVSRVHLLNGNLEHALILELFTEQGVGTMIVPD